MARFLKNRKLSTGKAPGSLLFIGQQKMDSPRIRVIHYSKESILEEEPDSFENINFEDNVGVTWINIDGVHDTNLVEKTGTRFNISPLTLEDILNTDHRPQFSETEDYLHFILKSFFYLPGDDTIHAEQISFLLVNKTVITFQERVGDFFEPVRARLRNPKIRIREKKSDYLLYALIDALVDSYMVNIEELGSRIEDLDDHILMNFQKDIINKIYKYKADLGYMRKSVIPLKEMISQFIKSEHKYINKETLIYLSDLEELCLHAHESVIIYSEMIMDNISLYNTVLSNKVNDVMKVLTIFASLFIPLTFIAGVYGMNFKYIPELSFKYGYLAFWIVIIVITILLLYFFRRKKWL